MSSKPGKSIAILAVAMSLLLVLLLVADFAIGVRSDAMRFAKAEIARSEALATSIGDISSVELRKLWGYGAMPGDGDEEARLSVIATGARGEKDLTVRVRKQDGQWVIVESSEPL